MSQTVAPPAFTGGTSPAAVNQAMRAQFDELIEAGGPDRSGNVPANVPERTAGVWATHRFTSWPLSLGAGVRGQGDLILRLKNLTDAFYVEWAVTANQMLVGMPRVVELSHQFRF